LDSQFKTPVHLHVGIQSNGDYHVATTTRRVRQSTANGARCVNLSAKSVNKRTGKPPVVYRKLGIRMRVDWVSPGKMFRLPCPVEATSVPIAPNGDGGVQSEWPPAGTLMIAVGDDGRRQSGSGQRVPGNARRRKRASHAVVVFVLHCGPRWSLMKMARGCRASDCRET